MKISLFRPFGNGEGKGKMTDRVRNRVIERLTPHHHPHQQVSTMFHGCGSDLLKTQKKKRKKQQEKKDTHTRKEAPQNERENPSIDLKRQPKNKKRIRPLACYCFWCLCPRPTYTLAGRTKSPLGERQNDEWFSSVFLITLFLSFFFPVFFSLFLALPLSPFSPVLFFHHLIFA